MPVRGQRKMFTTICFFFPLGIGGSAREVKFIRMFVKQCFSTRNISSTGNRIPKTVKVI